TILRQQRNAITALHTQTRLQRMRESAHLIEHFAVRDRLPAAALASQQRVRLVVIDRFEEQAGQRALRQVCRQGRVAQRLLRRGRRRVRAAQENSSVLLNSMSVASEWRTLQYLSSE